MALFSCLPLLIGRKKKDKGDDESIDCIKRLNTPQLKLEYMIKSSNSNEQNSTSYNVSIPYDTTGNSVIPLDGETAESAYEGEDEHGEYASFKRNLSDLDLQSENIKANSCESVDTEINGFSENNSENDAERGMIESGHVSDPGMVKKAEFCDSPKLKRTCSNLETRVVLQRIADQLPPSKSQSFEQLQELANRFNTRVGDDLGSPGSVRSHRSADRVMLKKHSLAQILPSRSRRLWWKLFLWSHRNPHKPFIVEACTFPITHVLNQEGGYSSDTVEPSRAVELRNTASQSPRSYSGESSKTEKKCHNKSDFHEGVSGLWPQNQWVAFGSESSFHRVDKWVKDLEIPLNIDDKVDSGIIFPPSTNSDRSPAKNTIERTRHMNANISDEILHANNVIRSLNASSTVAHIAGIGLKVVPTFSVFSSLRSVNLSNNLIVNINHGSLPKGLHTLNLSKNKISTIDGLRELTRLRIIDLSYNRISRIGHGLSNCTLIKELYLAGNKISDVEGLHRLLKLTVLDLSFNKITTTKAIGQVVANYNSLLALNLLGNPIQTTINEEQLRKSISGLLPKLAYLNKQPMVPKRAQLVTENVARAALGNSGWSSRRKAVKKVSQGVPSASHVRGSRHRSKSRTLQNSPLKISSSRLASSSR